MSKQLETEYKKLHTENLPDLWSRIESQLEEKNSTQEQTEENVTKKTVKKISIFRFASMAAALVLAIVGITSLLRFTGMKTAKDASMNQEFAMVTSADTELIAEETMASEEAMASDEATASVESVPESEVTVEQELITEEKANGAEAEKQMEVARVTLVQLDAETLTAKVKVVELVETDGTNGLLAGNEILLALDATQFELYQENLRTIEDGEFLISFSQKEEPKETEEGLIYRIEWMEF